MDQGKNTVTSLPRRRLLTTSLALTGLALFTHKAEALTSLPRQRVIIDNDFSGDPDGLFQLAHHLASPSIEIPLVIGSHIHVNDFLDSSTTQADNAVVKVTKIYGLMQLTHQPPVVAGYNAASPKGATPRKTQAAERIITEAMRDDTQLPLYYAAGAGLTELAEALKLEPKIGKRMKLVWIGGYEHGDLLPDVPPRRDSEYNTTINLEAVKTVFNDSDIEIWQVPRNVYRQLNISHAELISGLRPAGKLGAYLLTELEKVMSKVKNLGETYILGDSPLVTLTALQSSFDPDSYSSAYVVRPTPLITDAARYADNPHGRQMRVYLNIDTRLTFADMFAKFASAAR
ncbi:nucleoside hydrolase [Asticcacaulis sp. SL142]|uniref:nucleoside hydrolase n=1 Tax=Asticcacaulis sp. SL142 TaxID=2995155 RepID=UPI00226CE229|nr:nucleoside hydrolase [Asticcacaulis sp. SL142]WAC46866.1 nucleoside hydrolase [Asticcacaulis sp. SL142]